MLLKFGSAESIFYIYIQRERRTIVANFEIANIEKNNTSSRSVVVSISSKKKEKKKKKKYLQILHAKLEAKMKERSDKRRITAGSPPHG